MKTTIIKNGCIKDLQNKSLLLLGNPGTGKSFAIRKTIPHLLVDEKNVILIDLRNEHEETVTSLSGQSFVDINVEESTQNPLIRIHFGQDLLLTNKRFDLDFLFSLAPKTDYLIVDEAHLLFKNTYHHDSKTRLSVNELCSILFLLNPNLKLFFSIQNLDYLTEEDAVSILNIFDYRLLFHQRLESDSEYLQYALSLGFGEALLTKIGIEPAYISFNN